MKLTLCLFSALVLSTAVSTAQAQAQTATKKYFQRVPAQVSCPGGGCSSNAALIRPGTGAVVTPPTGGSGTGQNGGTIPGGGTSPGGGTTTPGVPNETTGGLWVSAYGVYFGPRAVNGLVQTKTVLLVNQGKTAISLAQSFTENGSSTFKFETDCGKSIGPGVSCSIDFTFDPEQPGYYTGYYKVQTASGDFQIELMGSGLLDEHTTPVPPGGGSQV